MADWFVVNVRDAEWRTHDVFGSSVRFEDPERPFDQLEPEEAYARFDEPREERPASWGSLPWSS